MTFTKFRNKSEFTNFIGMSHSTMYRRLKKVNYQAPRGLLSPREQQEIYCILNGEISNKSKGSNDSNMPDTK